MGQKVHPNGLRVGFFKDWNSRWFAEGKELPALLVEDTKLRRYIKSAYYQAGVSKVEIERRAQEVKITIHTGKPGMVIGKGGQGVEDLRKTLEKMTGKKVKIDIVEIRNPELDAQLVAEGIAQQLEKRIGVRRAMKQAITRCMRMGAKGVRLIISGRIGGAEIARSERDSAGTVPLHTLRADVDFGVAEASTTFGKIGVKCWLYRGEFGEPLPEAPKGDRRDRERGGRRGGGPDRGGRGGRGPRGDRDGDRGGR